MNNILNSKNNSKQLYDERFSSGYMEEWPDEKKKRVLKFIQSLGLPKSGKALDFGCGNGVFTEVLIKALPNWEIYGADISFVALSNAKKRVKTAKFNLIEDLLNTDIKFDFLFSHHVLEHVHDLDQIFSEITTIMNPEHSSMLHILPCGNPGSFEYEICAVRNDGIDKNKGHRFFFEDSGHVRRASSDLLSKSVRNYGYRLEKESYANQYFGALRWIAHSGLRFILKLTEIKNVDSVEGKKKLMQIRLKIIALSLMTRRIRAFFLRWPKPRKNFKDFLILFLSMPFFIFWPVYYWLEKQSEIEWKNNKFDNRGSEMFLYFINEV